MSENNEKIPEVKAKKSDKPNFFVRIGQKIKKFFKDYSSEMKKVVWLSKAEVRKNSLVVIVSVIVCAIAIGIVDLAFSSIISGLAQLI
jgi:preprotein translocase subunit SecE